MNQGIIAWIVVSKLCMTLKEQAFKDEDDKDDYLAMHVYPNNDIKGSKLYKAANAIIRSTYRSTQTVMLYLKLPNAQEYIDSNKLLNLVLDTMDRDTDLFFNVRIFSTHPFESNRC
jgi:hypothetical protein